MTARPLARAAVVAALVPAFTLTGGAPAQAAWVNICFTSPHAPTFSGQAVTSTARTRCIVGGYSTSTHVFTQKLNRLGQWVAPPSFTSTSTSRTALSRTIYTPGVYRTVAYHLILDGRVVKHSRQSYSQKVWL